jgi:hypothetical protein
MEGLPAELDRIALNHREVHPDEILSHDEQPEPTGE